MQHLLTTRQAYHTGRSNDAPHQQALPATNDVNAIQAANSRYNCRLQRLANSHPLTMHTSDIVVYGIKNCDTIKKTRTWFESRQISYRFHDYRLDGIEEALLQQFIAALGVDAILNKRSTSWRQLDDSQKADLTPDKAIKLMKETPTLIKRPIVSIADRLFVGFNPEEYSTVL